MARRLSVREPGAVAGSLVAGRRSFQRQAWADAYTNLAAADRGTPLALDDLERLAVAAYLSGEDRDCVAIWGRAHHECLRQGNAPRAARCAFWIAFSLLLQGEMAPSSGWQARAQRVLDDGDHDCVERGFLLVPVALGHLLGGDQPAALREFTDAMRIGERFGDPDVATLGRFGRGQALCMGGEIAAGVGTLDEAMVAVTSGEVSPMIAGLVYCGVIDMCQMLFDVRRAQEWTEALNRWCEAQPDLVPYRGQCLVHRAEILQFHGAWPDAMDEAQRAYVQLSRPPGHPAVGDALYRLAELLRLRGEFPRAEEAFRRASEYGRQPQPGLARLRLAQGQVEAAAVSIRRAVDETTDRGLRAHLLPAYIEVMLAVDDIEAARAAAEELAFVADTVQAPVLQAMSAHAAGLVLFAEDDARAALNVLRPAWAIWRDVEAPYEAAQVRLAVGLACRRLGDEDGASLEFEAAAGAFRELGATTDLAVVERLTSAAEDRAHHLSVRERQVLALMATGMTNRAIAGELVISEKTVARHVANIFTKLGLSSRAAATAYAYEHRLVDRYTQ